jgi:hypothetical protein
VAPEAVKLALLPTQIVVLPAMLKLGAAFNEMVTAAAVLEHTPLLPTNEYVVVTEGDTTMVVLVEPVLHE